jgi:hypothetical protein
MKKIKLRQMSGLQCHRFELRQTRPCRQQAGAITFRVPGKHLLRAIPDIHTMCRKHPSNPGVFDTSCEFNKPCRPRRTIVRLGKAIQFYSKANETGMHGFICLRIKILKCPQKRFSWDTKCNRASLLPAGADLKEHQPM